MRVPLIAALGVLLLAAPLAGADAPTEQEFDAVKTKDLAAAMRNYWARGVVFRDVLEQKPGGESIRLGGRKVHTFKTRVLGDCYVDASLLKPFANLKTGREYLFSGIVDHQKGGLFREERFYVVVQRVSGLVQDLDKLPEELRRAVQVEQSAPAAFRMVERTLSLAQENLLAFCSSERIELQDLFGGDTNYANRVSQAVRSAVYKAESEAKTPALETYIDLLTTVLNARLNPAPQAQTPAEEPAAAATPEAAAEPAIAPAEQGAGESGVETPPSTPSIGAKIAIPVEPEAAEIEPAVPEAPPAVESPAEPAPSEPAPAEPAHDEQPSEEAPAPGNPPAPA